MGKNYVLVILSCDDEELCKKNNNWAMKSMRNYMILNECKKSKKIMTVIQWELIKVV